MYLLFSEYGLKFIGCLLTCPAHISVVCFFAAMSPNVCCIACSDNHRKLLKTREIIPTALEIFALRWKFIVLNLFAIIIDKHIDFKVYLSISNNTVCCIV